MSFLTSLLWLTLVAFADVPTPAQVERMIAGLRAPTRAARLKAEQEMLEAGPDLLPLLPPPELVPSAARESLVRIRVTLERRQALLSIAPSHVTLQGERSFSEWVNELQRQSTNTNDLRSLSPTDLDQPLKLDFKDQTYWAGVEELSRMARLKPDLSAGHLRWNPADPNVVPELAVTHAGAFRVAVIVARTRPGLTADKPLVRLGLTLMAEPRLRPLFMHFSAEDMVLRGGSGALAAFNPEAKYELVLADGKSPPIQIDAVAQAPPPDTVDISGRFRVTLAAGSEAIRFSDLPAFLEDKPSPVSRRRGGVTVTLQKVELEPATDGKQNARIQVLVAYDTGGPAFESHRSWVQHNRVFLETASGQTIELNGGQETTAEANGRVGAAYTFNDLTEPLANLRFVYVAPTLILETPVEFQFKQIPVTNR